MSDLWNQPMTVGKLIEKLQGLPPSTLVCTDDNESPVTADIGVYLMRWGVTRTKYSTWIEDRDDGKHNLEPVVLISRFGQDDDAVEL